MRSSLNIAAALVAGAAIGVAIVSCVKAPAPPDRPLETDQIAALDTEIRKWRVEAGLKVEPPANMVNQFRDKTVPFAERVCADSAPPEACDDICNLADAICDNAEDICRIADKLGNDSWSKQKCDSAKASCREAKQECCNCKDKDVDIAIQPPAVPSPSAQ
jgi:hypothetical protein